MYNFIRAENHILSLHLAITLRFDLLMPGNFLYPEYMVWFGFFVSIDHFVAHHVLYLLVNLVLLFVSKVA